MRGSNVGVFACVSRDYTYAGQYKNGKMHGSGVMIADGNEYRGEWTYGSMSGLGVYTYSNGDKYIGEFANDKQHGKGRWMIASHGFLFADRAVDSIWDPGVDTGISHADDGGVISRAVEGM